MLFNVTVSRSNSSKWFPPLRLAFISQLKLPDRNRFLFCNIFLFYAYQSFFFFYKIELLDMVKLSLTMYRKKQHMTNENLINNNILMLTIMVRCKMAALFGTSYAWHESSLCAEFRSWHHLKTNPDLRVSFVTPCSSLGKVMNKILYM